MLNNTLAYRADWLDKKKIKCCEYDPRCGLQRHIQTVHENKRNYHCPICKLDFGRKDTLNMHTKEKCYKTFFTSCNLRIWVIAKVFVPDRPFQPPSHIWVNKADAYLSEVPIKVLALLTNIRLGWKGLPWTNAQAYYDHL